VRVWVSGLKRVVAVGGAGVIVAVVATAIWLGEGVKRASVKSTGVQVLDVLQNTYTQPQPTITVPSVG